MNRHTINEGFGAPLFSARARVAFGSGITPLADRDVSNTSATRIEVMGCRSASLNGWPGTQGTSVLPDEMPREQLGFRLARVKGFSRTR